MTTTSEVPVEREQSMLNLICLIGGGLFLLLVGYNLFAAGNIISTDGLFFTVVPTVLGLSLLVVRRWIFSLSANRRKPRPARANQRRFRRRHRTPHPK